MQSFSALQTLTQGSLDFRELRIIKDNGSNRFLYPLQNTLSGSQESTVLKSIQVILMQLVQLSFLEETMPFPLVMGYIPRE